MKQKQRKTKTEDDSSDTHPYEIKFVDEDSYSFQLCGNTTYFVPAIDGHKCVFMSLYYYLFEAEFLTSFADLTILVNKTYSEAEAILSKKFISKW